MILILIFSSCFLIGMLLYLKRSPKTILIVVAVLLTALICFFCWAASEDENYVMNVPAFFKGKNNDTLAVSGISINTVTERVIQRTTSSENDGIETYYQIEKDTWQMSL
ncbi:MAG: hypothetical protein LBE92_07205 [Chryseobacterium sp.]|jgi:multisubunit Na+/H+ antiporter MnhC subunit|uniref:hypothetical protein n=1 Tax=Chryseobacterium sp. TaxID=1871047 RepID=UPI00281CC36A|nr:hypothetical protein [Chryseobacterium sp.]MDR2235895.1 hypothetical protein [Chryseobacterium sp.]